MTATIRYCRASLASDRRFLSLLAKGRQSAQDARLRALRLHEGECWDRLPETVQRAVVRP